MTDTSVPASRPRWLPTDFRSRGLALAAVAVLQLALLGAIIQTHVQLLRNGREIVLHTTVADPRDIFRGDYVILNYPAAQLPAPGPVAGLDEALAASAAGRPVFAVLQPTAGGDWSLDRLSTDATVPPADVAIRVQSLQKWTRRLEFGIERYYVPEGKGHDLEALIRQKRLDVVVAVGKHGETGIKGLSVDGNRIMEEPLY